MLLRFNTFHDNHHLIILFFKSNVYVFRIIDVNGWKTGLKVIIVWEKYYLPRVKMPKF